MASVKKETVERLHEYCQRGEKHDNLVNRLIDVCEKGKKEVNLSKETLSRLLDFTGGADFDDALNMLIDKYNIIGKK